MLDHPRHLFRGHLAGSDDEVAFVLSALSLLTAASPVDQDHGMKISLSRRSDLASNGVVDIAALLQELVDTHR